MNPGTPVPAGEEELRRQTRAHYDEHPFDFIARWPAEKIEASHSPLLRELVRQLPEGARVLDVGCGVGRFVRYALRSGLPVLGTDLSGASLRVLRQAEPGAALVQADNLYLPFPDGFAPLVVSDGVIHHTPDARRALAENVRVLRPGGVLFLAVYKRWRYYYCAYRYLGGLLRWMSRRSLGRRIVEGWCVPLYRRLHNWKSPDGLAVSPEGARKLFYDYFLTPRAVFLSRAKVCDWGEQEGLEILRYDRNPSGNCHFFVFRKT